MRLEEEDRLFRPVGKRIVSETGQGKERRRKQTHPHSSIRQKRLARSATEVVDAVNGRRRGRCRDRIFGRDDGVGLLAKRVPKELLLPLRRLTSGGVKLLSRSGRCRCPLLLLLLVRRLREKGFDGGRRGALHARVEVGQVGVRRLICRLMGWRGDVGRAVGRVLVDALMGGGRKSGGGVGRSVDHLVEGAGGVFSTSAVKDEVGGGREREREPWGGSSGLQLVQERRTRAGGGGRERAPGRSSRVVCVGRRLSD